MTAAPAPLPALQAFAAGDVLRRLCRIDILRALPPEEVQALVPHVDYARLPRGTQLMKRGDVGDSLYFIESGTAWVERPDQDPVFVGAGPQSLPSEQWWVSTATRAIEARYRGLTTWQLLMGAGLWMWVLLLFNDRLEFNAEAGREPAFALYRLVAGLLIVQGACEAFVQGVERLGARLKWDGFISGTVGSLLSTLPEFVVIAFLVQVEPLAAFVTAAVTIFNNGLVFSIYAFFLPKDRRGAFAMPRSLTIAGGEIMIAGATAALVVGLVMLVLRVTTPQTVLEGVDLIGIGLVLIMIYAYYVLTLVRYYAEGKDDEESLPFAMMVIGGLGLATGDAGYVIPINEVTMLLVLLLFPLFYALHQHMEMEGTLSNLDAASMTGIYLLLLYFLFTAAP